MVAEGLEGWCGAMRPCHPLGEQQGNAAAGQMDGRVGGWTDGWMDGFFMSKPRSKMFRWIPTFLVAGVMLS